MGSGGMIVMDESSCMVDVAKYFMDFCMTESCGKCIPCRVGTYQMHRILTAIGNMNATPQDIKMLEELCDLMRHTSLCGLGQSAPNPVVSTLRTFADEYRGLRTTSIPHIITTTLAKRSSATSNLRITSPRDFPTASTG